MGPVGEPENSAAKNSGSRPNYQQIRDGPAGYHPGMFRASALLMVSLSAASAGCDTPVTFSSIQSDVLTPRCATAGCHDSGERPAGQLALVAGRSYAALVGQPARNVGAVDEGLLLVKPGDPDQSFLVLKVREHVPVRYGIPMPQSNRLSSDEVARIEAWVAAGAPND